MPTVTARRSNRLIVGRVEAGVLAEADRGGVGRIWGEPAQGGGRAFRFMLPR